MVTTDDLGETRIGKVLRINPVQIEGGWTLDGGDTPLFGTYRRNTFWQPREHDGLDLYEIDPDSAFDGRGPEIKTGGVEALVSRGSFGGYGNTIITMTDMVDFDPGEMHIDVRRVSGSGSEFPDRHGAPADHSGADRTERETGSANRIVGEVKSISSFTLYGHLRDYGEDVARARVGDILNPGANIGEMGRSGFKDSEDHLHLEHWLRLDMEDGSTHIVPVDPQALLGNHLDGDVLDLTDQENLEKILANGQTTRIGSIARNFNITDAHNRMGVTESPRPMERPDRGPQVQQPELYADLDDLVIPGTDDMPIRLTESFYPMALGEPATPQELPHIDQSVPPSPFEQDPVGRLAELAHSDDPNARTNIQGAQRHMSSDGLYVREGHRYYADGDAGGLTEHGALLAADADGSYARDTIRDVMMQGSLDERSLIRFQTATNRLNALAGEPLIEVDGKGGRQTYTAMLDYAEHDHSFQVAGNIESQINRYAENGQTLHELRLAASPEGNYALTHMAMTIEKDTLSRDDILRFQQSTNALNEIEGRPAIDVDGVAGGQTYGAMMDFVENVGGMTPSTKVASNLETRFPERYAQAGIEGGQTPEDSNPRASQFEVAALGDAPASDPDLGRVRPVARDTTLINTPN